MLVLFDFSKAFDRVSHKILLDKLKQIGFSLEAINWFRSYLSQRQQAVMSKNGKCSKWNTVIGGVPQGSIFGPLFFLIYIDDLRHHIKHSKHILYADDLQIYVQCGKEHMSETIKNINSDISSILDWSISNKLFLNLGKTQAIAFGDVDVLEELYASNPININGTCIPLEHSVKNLGVILDSSLSWSEQIKKTCRNVNFALYRLRYFRHLTDESLRTKLVSSLVLPHIDYCSTAMGELNQGQNAIFQKLINSGIRYIKGARMRDSITPIRLQMGWLSAYNRRLLLALSLIYKTLKTKQPSYLREKIKNYDFPRILRPLNRELAIPISKSGCYDRSIFVYAVRYWNTLPLHIRHSSNINIFQTQIQNHLLNTEKFRYLIPSRI